MKLMPLLELLQMNGLGAAGTDLFLNMMPSTVTRATMLREPLTGTEINYELPEYYETEFQVIVRSPDYEDGLRLINDVVKAMTLEEEWVEDMYFRYCRPKAKPVAFPISDGALIEYTVKMCACFNEED